MKTFFALFVTIFATTVANANGGEKIRISTYLYFAPRNAENPGHSDWPAKLILEPLPAQPLEAFKKAIQGEWMAGFHCGGSGVSAAELEQAGMWDGIANQNVTYDFEDNVVTQTLSSGGPSSISEVMQTQSGRFEIQSLGDNKFKLIFPKNVADVSAIFEFKRVIETGTMVLNVIDENPAKNNARCFNGNFIEGVLSPTQGS